MSASKSTSGKKPTAAKVGASVSSSGTRQPTAAAATITQRPSFKSADDVRSIFDEDIDDLLDDGPIENEEVLHERMHRKRHHHHHHGHRHHNHQDNNNSNPAGPQPHHHHHHHHGHHHHHHHQHGHHDGGGHIKELIKPDPTLRPAASGSHAAAAQRAATASKQPRPVVTVVDEEQLHKRLLQSVAKASTAAAAAPKLITTGGAKVAAQRAIGAPSFVLASKQDSSTTGQQNNSTSSSKSSSGSSSSRSSASSSYNHLSSLRRNRFARDAKPRSPPPSAIIIPAQVARSMSARSSATRTSSGSSGNSNDSAVSQSLAGSGQSITKAQLDYGPVLKSGEVQVLYSSPEPVSTADRLLKDEQAKQVAPNLKQSPIAFMSVNPTYERLCKPLSIEYPATVENLRLTNTGAFWEVKIPYQISMTTALFGAQLNSMQRYKLDQFHCHWGESDEQQGSEHTVDNRGFSAELHFVHYNMEKYHTFSKAARHPDGLAVVGVFIEASEDHHNHAELEKIVTNLKTIQLKAEHTIIKQTVRLENLLPANRSFWAYSGSLTTPPYLESVSWFVFKHPIKCSRAQIQKFRNLQSSLKPDPNLCVTSNFRKTQPLNGRTIFSYDSNGNNSFSSRLF